MLVLCEHFSEYLKNSAYSSWRKMRKPAQNANSAIEAVQ
jgi:hypothetical protein